MQTKTSIEIQKSHNTTPRFQAPLIVDHALKIQHNYLTFKILIKSIFKIITLTASQPIPPVNLHTLMKILGSIEVETANPFPAIWP